MSKEDYNGVEDAEATLTRIMKRQRFTVDLRDELKSALERIVTRECAKKGGGWHGKRT